MKETLGNKTKRKKEHRKNEENERRSEKETRKYENK